MLCVTVCLPGPAQTTQGVINGRIIDSVTGSPVPDATVSLSSEGTSTQITVRADSRGYYTAASIPPGPYRVRATAEKYQAQEAFNLELAIAGRLEVNLRLRPLSDVWESGEQRSVFLPGSRSLVTFFGPDVDTSRTSFVEAPRGSRGALEATISGVIEPREIQYLPLAGRDLYATLSTQGGVTSDATTARSLGLSANGQRPTSSSFYLDGVQNNNFLITGPLTTIAPEAVQEYRVSTNNFSAEYGGTAGYVANAVTRAGGNQWHGLGYFYMKDRNLNANGFQQNRLGYDRPGHRERRPGYQAGGPIRRDRLFVSNALEAFRGRTFGDPETLLFPTAAAIRDFSPPGSTGRKLLERFPGPIVSSSRDLTAEAVMRRPSTVNRLVLLERGDWIVGAGSHRVTGRAAISRSSRPDFVWSPYPDFISGSRLDDTSIMTGVQNNFRPNLIHEARVAHHRNDLNWDSAHPEIPAVLTGDGTVLPGSPSAYVYRYRTRAWEFQDNWTFVRGPHIARFGGTYLRRDLSGYLTFGRDGVYGFETFFNYLFDEPLLFQVALDREAFPNLRPVDNASAYRQSQGAFYGQDTIRVTPRLTLNLGFRYENFGVPVNTGRARDLIAIPGEGADVATRLRNVRLVSSESRQGRIYDGDGNDWGARFGFSRSLPGGAVLRGAYGIFFDRMFDNAWQNVRNNRILTPQISTRGRTVDITEPVATALQRYRGSVTGGDFPLLTLIQPGFRTSYAQTYFLGVQTQPSERWRLELSGTGALGRKLMTTDVVNRSVRGQARGMSYRANQGVSNYHSMIASLRYSAPGATLHFAYTWSHAIDNQSDPFLGEGFDLAAVAGGSGRVEYAAFTEQGNSRGDRGDSNFDQRHSAVVYSVWDLPGRWLRGWKVAQMAALRSGLPYSLVGGSTVTPDGRVLLLNSPNLIARNPEESTPVAGGVRLLRRNAFQLAPDRSNLGRNTFVGPGFFNVDLSVSRSFDMPWLGESGRVTFRGDAFNVLNHANLGLPFSIWQSASEFGIALFGRRGVSTGLPAIDSWSETARQVQLMLRVEF
jgi:hypothetical protein